MHRDQPLPSEPGRLSQHEITQPEQLNEAVDLNNRLLKREPELRVKSEQAPYALRNRGRLLVQLKRYDEAIRDFDLAIKDANPGMRPDVQCDRARAWIDSGGYYHAVLDLRESLDGAATSSSSHVLANQSIRFAKLCVECGSRALQDSSLDEQDRGAISESSFRSAIEFLEKGKGHGFKNFDSLQHAPEFEPIHRRIDFSTLFQ